MKTTPRNAKREAEKWFEIIIKVEHNASPEKLSEDITYLLFKYYALVVQGCNYYTEPDIVLLFICFGVFEGGTRLAMSKKICEPDTSSLKLGQGLLREFWIRGSPGVRAMWHGTD